MPTNYWDIEMNPQGDPLADDIAYIFDECKRIMDMGREVFKLLPKDDVFFDLPNPSGRGRMLCGRAAALRVAKLADEAGRRAGISRRVVQRTLRRPTEDLLVQRFVLEERDLSKKQIDRFLASVGRKAREACEDITHFIPCTLMTAQDPEMLAVGPVIFHNRASFRRKFLVHVKAYDKEEEDESRRKRARSLMAASARFYRHFDWVAEVTVRNCDPKMSAKVAERVTTSALDCLHLILQARYSSKMRVGGPALRTDRRAGVTIDRNGKMHAHGSTSWAGQVNFADGWSEQLKDPVFAHLLSLCGLATESIVDPI